MNIGFETVPFSFRKVEGIFSVKLKRQHIKVIVVCCVVLLHILPFVVVNLGIVTDNNQQKVITVGIMSSSSSIMMQSGGKSVQKSKMQNVQDSKSNFAKQIEKPEMQNSEKQGNGDTDSSASAAVEYAIGSENNPAPQYPAFAKRNGYEGRVNVCANINSEGVPVSVVVCQSSGYSVLDNAALNTIKKWTFTVTSTFDGVKSVVVPINFILN